jgi:hypothetical protein
LNLTYPETSRQQLALKLLDKTGDYLNLTSTQLIYFKILPSSKGLEQLLTDVTVFQDGV